MQPNRLYFRFDPITGQPMLRTKANLSDELRLKIECALRRHYDRLLRTRPPIIRLFKGLTEGPTSYTLRIDERQNPRCPTLVLVEFSAARRKTVPAPTLPAATPVATDQIEAEAARYLLS